MGGYALEQLPKTLAIPLLRVRWQKSSSSTKTTPSNEREEVEGYLAQKWGLTGSLPSGHSSLIKYKDDTTNGTGKSLDLSNGVSAVVQTGGTENVFDPGYTFSTSMWVKGWPSAAGESILNKNDFNPGSMGN
jgi:hypothetical protein